jgi:hypothetical protein
MTFLLPTALAALVLVGIPLALHLLRREEVRNEDFPALRYLPPEARTSDRRLRVRERILLALRLAAVVAAVFAAARWLVPTGTGHLPPADLVLVVDDGIGSGAVVEGRRILDRQRELAMDLLASLGPLDRVWLIPASEALSAPWLPRLSVSPAEARVLLGRPGAGTGPGPGGRTPSTGREPFSPSGGKDPAGWWWCASTGPGTVAPLLASMPPSPRSWRSIPAFPFPKTGASSTWR